MFFSVACVLMRRFAVVFLLSVHVSVARNTDSSHWHRWRGLPVSRGQLPGEVTGRSTGHRSLPSRISVLARCLQSGGTTSLRCLANRRRTGVNYSRRLLHPTPINTLYRLAIPRVANKDTHPKRTVYNTRHSYDTRFCQTFFCQMLRTCSRSAVGNLIGLKFWFQTCRSGCWFVDLVTILIFCCILVAWRHDRWREPTTYDHTIGETHIWGRCLLLKYIFIQGDMFIW